MSSKYSRISREKSISGEGSVDRIPLNRVDLVNERARQQRYNAVLHRIKRSFHRETERLHFTNVLEIECGTGSDILHLAKRYPKIQFTGIDASEENIRQAKKRAIDKIAPNVRFICLSIDRLSEVRDGGKFDLVCMYLNKIDCLT
ncbi:MAG: class I SAM-dependent methyltransferase [Balneolales bacterium]|nr:class I SAM-dependent methyltransferase [Balneolales bacterium]